ncbi:hypothetical protein [Methylobacterium sp. WL7]|uniref:hypothetical protein n=1 Tax=Methylobacterium sp. WL7 TaxID=2603900 RepID=UPI0011CC54BC|nr:hypothetical protein [Methylobacterium sp. WL7]TXN42680.1 hypothetical protein FV233_21710 [Methylobacterium sp. WL7]
MSRGHLLEFLISRQVAAQIDNLFVRMLLSPHPLIPRNGFIDYANDDIVLREAAEKLSEIEWAGISEDINMYDRLSSWLGIQIHEQRSNETLTVPFSQKGVLSDHLTSATLDALEARSRLDLKLWRLLAAKTNIDPEALRWRATTTAAARFSQLLTYKVY